jgi:hypothetical protein
MPPEMLDGRFELETWRMAPNFYFTGKVMRMVVPEPICDLIRTLP